MIWLGSDINWLLSSTVKLQPFNKIKIWDSICHSSILSSFINILRFHKPIWRQSLEWLHNPSRQRFHFCLLRSSVEILNNLEIFYILDPPRSTFCVNILPCDCCNVSIFWIFFAVSQSVLDTASWRKYSRTNMRIVFVILLCPSILEKWPPLKVTVYFGA